MKTMLIGSRASGKSTVGRLLAKIWDQPFIDLDVRVLAMFDEQTVEAIWANHGEAAWRKAECQALEQVIAEPGAAVVALGGGTPCIDEARPILVTGMAMQDVRMVYLRYDAEVLSARLSACAGDRPSITGEDVPAEVGQLLDRREAIYRDLADVMVEPSPTQTADETAAMVAEAFVQSNA